MAELAVRSIEESMRHAGRSSGNTGRLSPGHGVHPSDRRDGPTTQALAKLLLPNGPLDRAFIAAGRSRSTQRPEQSSYMHVTASLFDRALAAPRQPRYDTADGSRRPSGMVGLIEADTGLGKTLGYLVPLMAAIATAPADSARGIISTYTRALQRQISQRDAKIASAAVHEVTGRHVTVARRPGRSAFVSASRVRNFLDLLIQEQAAPEVLDQVKAFAEWAEAADEGIAGPANTPHEDGIATGEMDDWRTECGALPAELSDDDIALLSYSGDDGAWRRRVHAAKGADVIIVTHRLLMASALYQNSLLEPTSDRADDMPEHQDSADTACDWPCKRVLLVIDEAHTLHPTAASVAVQRLPLSRLTALANSPVGTPDLIAACAALSGAFETLRAELPKSFSRTGKTAAQVFPDAEHNPQVTGTLAPALAHYASALQKIKTKIQANRRHAGLAEEAHLVSDLLGNLLRGMAPPTPESRNGSKIVLAWSPLRSYPSIWMQSTPPALLIRRLWGDPKKVPNADEPPPVRAAATLITGATLDAPGSADDATFILVRRELGILRQDRFQDDLARRFEPRRFGTVSKMVLGQRDAPLPFLQPDGDDQQDPGIQLNDAWVGYIAAQLARAHAAGGRTLVILPSYRDTHHLEPALRALGLCDRDLIVQSPGVLAAQVADFKASSSRLWLAVSVWAGLDLPGVIDRVVIPRLPYPPMPDLAELTLEAGSDPQGTAWARSRRYLSSRAEAKRRLRQGLGRGLRQDTDRCEWWILDPRFPQAPEITADAFAKEVDQHPRYADFGAVIPRRFRKVWRQASFS